MAPSRDTPSWTSLLLMPTVIPPTRKQARFKAPLRLRRLSMVGIAKSILEFLTSLSNGMKVPYNYLHPDRNCWKSCSVPERPLPDADSLATAWEAHIAACRSFLVSLRSSFTPSHGASKKIVAAYVRLQLQPASEPSLRMWNGSSAAVQVPTSICFSRMRTADANSSS